MIQPASTDTQGLSTSATHIAASFAQSVGADACYLALTFAPNTDVLLVTSHEAPLDDEIVALLHRANEQGVLIQTETNGEPALALPLCYDGHLAGAALLRYAHNATVNLAQAQAGANMAAAALSSAIQVVVLRSYAVEIEQQARVREIQVSRNLIRGVIDSIPLGLALLNAEGMLLAINRSLSDRFERDPTLLVGTHYSAFIGRWEESPAAHTFTTGTNQRLQRSLTKADGTTALLEIASFPLRDADGQPYQAVEVWDDITQRVSLQTQLVRAEKLAAIGQLAASIAHEVGNPLQAIQGFLSLFLEQCPPETPNRHFLELTEGEIDRIVQVISRLRDLYRPRVDVAEPVDVNDLIDGVLLLTSKQLERGHIRVICEQDAAIPYIQIVANQIKQVLLNLVLNATEAMRDGGVLHIQSSARTTRAEGSVVIVSVTDTGVGIPPEQMVHIFDGLHTTKERGMGLGLYTSRAIIEQHMGRLTVQSMIGQGTTFTITLPVGT